MQDSNTESGKGHPLESNPNWKGGETVSTNGYVLIKRPDHPDSDTRGYIYEHRLVAEEKLGRRIKSDEHVHHKNGDKTDNRPENLEVLSPHEHRVKHRDNDDLRDPGEPNPEIECACRCGNTLSKYDEIGRRREYISGHNPQPSPTQNEVLNALQDGPTERSEIIESVGKTESAVATALTSLKEKGKVVNPVYGVWALPEHANEVDDERKENPVVECACGCGETFLKYDESDRPREYVTGHNSDSPVRDGILSALSEGPMRRKELAEEIGTSRDSVGSALSRLRERGKVQKSDGWGEWELTNGGESDAGE